MSSVLIHSCSAEMVRDAPQVYSMLEVPNLINVSKMIEIENRKKKKRSSGERMVPFEEGEVVSAVSEEP